MPLYEGAIFSVERRDGRDVVVHGPAVAIVPVDRDGHVTLVRQQRVPAGGKVLELPAGGVEEGESPLQTAQRELREETGLHGGEWVEVAAFFTSPGYSDEKLHLFVAKDLEQGDASPEGSEEIEVVRVPVSELERVIAECDDAKTLAGLLLLTRHL
ncbi:MAG TPA: NUDIX hydrolase [Gaiellaceae bacterium]|jgi:ADP-ribose pyrophosphatase|nr:NUDIX hydrolase [Gaiellaceae bacterium]